MPIYIIFFFFIPHLGIFLYAPYTLWVHENESNKIASNFSTLEGKFLALVKPRGQKEPTVMSTMLHGLTIFYCHVINGKRKGNIKNTKITSNSTKKNLPSRVRINMINIISIIYDTILWLVAHLIIELI